MDPTVLFDLSYGVYVVGTKDGTRPVGCVANTVFQVTAEPMTVGVSISKENFTEHCIRESGMFSVSILSEDTPQEVIGTFGFRSGKDTDKFSLVRTMTTEKGMPVVDEETVSYFSCRVLQEVDMMTHTIFIGEVIETGRLHSKKLMTYAYYHQVKKGRTAKNAPTYQAAMSVLEDKKEVGYVCAVCGYVFEGTEEEFSALSADWKCPVCGAGKDKFTKAPSKETKKHYVCNVCGYIFDGTEEEFLALPADWRCPVCGVEKSNFSLRMR